VARARAVQYREHAGFDARGKGGLTVTWFDWPARDPGARGVSTGARGYSKRSAALCRPRTGN